MRIDPFPKRTCFPGTCSVPARRLKKGVPEDLDELVVAERTVEIHVNGRYVARMQCLQSQLRELAAGFLLTTRAAEAPEQMRFIVVKADPLRVCVQADISITTLRALASRGSVPSGCAGGFFDPSLPDPLECERKINLMLTIAANDIPALMKEFQSRSVLYQCTGGLHSAAIIRNGQFLAFAEDVGRHNAVDKVIGACALADVPVDTAILLTSGRVSMEVALKAAHMRIPVVISPSAPTDRAIEIARSVHTTLIGFARGHRMNVYSGFWRTDPANQES